MHVKKQFNKQISSLPGKSVSVLAALIMTLTSGVATADDTEVFFARESAAPNILLIMDTSGSMDNLDGTGQTRLDRLKDALNGLLTTTNGINVGLMTYGGHNTGFQHPVEPINENRADLLNTISGLDHVGATPTLAALFQGKLYFAGEELAIAKHRSLQGDSGDVAKSRKYRLMDSDLYTGGFVVRQPNCTDADLNHRDCANEKIVGTATYNSPIASECQSNHIVLLTDGIPSNNHSARIGDLIEADLGIGACDLAPGHPEGGRCAAELTNYMLDNPINASVDKSTVKTHTIGFELSGSPEKLAAADWLRSLSNNERHYDAGSPESLTEAFANIFKSALQETNAFVAPAITVDSFSGLSHREDVYLGLFLPNESQNWQGNLKRYSYKGDGSDATPMLRDETGALAINPVTGTFDLDAKSWWLTGTDPDGDQIHLGGAANQLGNNRNVYTNLGSNNLSTDNDNEVHEINGRLSSTELGVPDWERENLVKWARGVDVLDYDKNPATTIRRQMGDPLHSKPVLVTYGKSGAEAESVVFIGTNEGYLHAINTIDGKEVFSFIPKELLKNLNTFYKNEPRDEKLYGLDGDTTVWTHDGNNDGAINNTATDHAYLYIGMRRGGNNYYALDVTEKEKPKILWTIEGGYGDFTNLGQSWSKPTLANISVAGKATKVLIFGGGYDKAQDNKLARSEDGVGNSLFVVNAETGDLIWKADDSNFPAMGYSIPSNPNVIDVNGDGLSDQIYVGDLGGQVWRFDINNAATIASDVFDGGPIANLAGNNAADFRKFFYSPDVALIKGNGITRDYLTVSIGSGNRAHPLGETVDNRFYMIRQYSVNGAPEEYGIDVGGFYRPLEERDLYNATDNDVASTDAVIANAAKKDLAEAPGWVIHLTAPGEKVLSKSLTINSGLNFNAYIPSVNTADICAPEIGRSVLYRLGVTDATATENIDGSPADRQTDESSGLKPGPKAVVTPDGVYIQNGNDTVETPELDPLRRTYWSEQTQD